MIARFTHKHSEHHGDKFEFKEVPLPQPGPRQALVKIVSSGVCHTDIHAVDGDWPAPTILPLIPGHEGAGIVVAIGSAVTNVKVSTTTYGSMHRFN